MQAVTPLEPCVDGVRGLFLSRGRTLATHVRGARDEVPFDLRERVVPVLRTQAREGISAAFEQLGLAAEGIRPALDFADARVFAQALRVGEQRARTAQRIAEERHEIIRAVQKVRQGSEESAELVAAVAGGFRIVVGEATLQPAARGAQEVDGEQREAALFERALQPRVHR